MDTFADRLCEAITSKRAPCVVGLDPRIEDIPDDFVRACGLSREDGVEACARLVEAYCALTIEAVHDLVPALKPQMAYFERFGSYGMRALENCIDMARSLGLLVLLDGKRGDIGSTSEAYAEAYLARVPRRSFEVDAMTLNPYLGRDSLEPFVRVAQANQKGLFVCVRTSNPGADVVQTFRGGDGTRLYEVVADLVDELGGGAHGTSGFGDVGAVVGATQPEAAGRLRERLPSTLFLVPGFGAQGGSAEVVRACFDVQGRGAIVNSSRAIMFPHRFGERCHAPTREGIRAAAREFVDAVRAVLP